MNICTKIKGVIKSTLVDNIKIKSFLKKTIDKRSNKYYND